MADFYTAELVGPEGTETIELEFIDGLPQKSLVRPSPGFQDDRTEDIVWELDESAADGFRYAQAGRPGRDYS